MRYKLARLAAAVWRFQTLRLAKVVFAERPADSILQRPMCGATLHLDFTRDPTGMLFLEGERTLEERSLIRALARRGDRAVDVGASVGPTLLLLESLVGSEGRVVCFEPLPDNLEELRRNAAQFSNVELISAAVGDCEGSVMLSRTHNAVVKESGEVKVPIVTIDSQVSGRIDFMKIDIEGFEINALRGAARVIREHRPRLVIEVHPTMFPPGQSVKDIFDLLNPYYGRLTLYKMRPGRVAALASRYMGSLTLIPVDPSPYLSGRCLERCWLTAS